MRNPWNDGIDPCELPYGPGNPDYEYDAERQRKDEERDDETALALRRYIALAVAGAKK